MTKVTDKNNLCIFSFFGPRDDIVPLIIGETHFEGDILNCELFFTKKHVITLLKSVNLFIYIDSNEFDRTNEDVRLFLQYFHYLVKKNSQS